MKQWFTKNKQMIASLIGVSIMLFFSLLPLESEFITPIGFKVIGVFLGTIFMWSVGSLIWPSILSVVLLGWFGFSEMPVLLNDWMGNRTVVMIFFLLVLVGGFQYRRGTAYVARFFLTRKIMEGRPWVFTFIILIGTYLMATFVNPWAGVFLFLPVIQNICKDIGFSKRDLYTQLMTITVVMTALLGFPSSYFNGTILALNSNYTQISGQEIHGGAYMGVTIPVSILSIIAMVLIMKWIIKPDLTPLKDITVEKLNRESLPPMSRIQLIISLGIVIFIIAMLFPVVFSNNRVAELIQTNINGIAMTIVAVLALITVKGEPVLPFTEVMKHNFSWPTYLIIATSLLLGDALTSDTVGFTALLENLLSPIFQNMGILALTILAVILGVLISNVMNSVVVVLILQPIIYTYSQIAGVDVAPIIALMTFSTIGFAAITPSASPYAATIFAQKDYVMPLEVYKYTSLFVFAQTIILLSVGIPLARLLF